MKKTAFQWDIYNNRKTALQYLKQNNILIDTKLETEDGKAAEYVHSQVISAFGDKLSAYIQQNGDYIESTTTAISTTTTKAIQAIDYNIINNNNININININNNKGSSNNKIIKIKRIRLPKVNKYTLDILVECAYTGYIRTDLASGGIWKVLDVAEHYEMSEVSRACCVFLTKNLSRSNCVKFYHIGIRHKHPLQRNAFHHIRANFKLILADNLAQNFENDLTTIKYEHFEALLMDDRLNVDNEESVWFAIKLWCNHNSDNNNGLSKVTTLLPCIRFPRFRSGFEFSAKHIWCDPLVVNNKKAQSQLSVLERNHRDYLASPVQQLSRDGFSLPCAPSPRQLKPRVPHSILLAIGGWQQGQPTTLIEAYDVNCNLWFDSTKKIMMPLAYHGIENIEGLLYICGGTDGNEILNELFTFNPIRGDCAQKPSMYDARCYVSTAHLEGYLYAMGGHNGNIRMKSVERYHIKNENWFRVKDMNVARSDASACVYGQLIYIAGGLNDQLIESSVEFYNPNDDSWTFIGSMLTPRTSFTLLLYQQTLLAIGGNSGSERLSSVEQYNFKTKLWSHHSQMRHRRSTFSAALVEDGSKLIVVGGYNGQTPFNQVEMYEEQSRSWIMLQKIRFDRSGLKVVVVSDLPNASDYTYLGSVGAGSTYNGSIGATLASSS